MSGNTLALDGQTYAIVLGPKGERMVIRRLPRGAWRVERGPIAERILSGRTTWAIAEGNAP